MKRIFCFVLALGLISLVGNSAAQGDRPNKKGVVVFEDAHGKWVVPDAMPTVTGLLQGYGLSPDEPDSLAKWLTQAIWQAKKVSLVIEIDWAENSPDNPARYWEAHGQIDGQDCTFWLNLRNGKFTITTILDTGEDEILSYQVVTPESPAPNEPILSYLLAKMGCHCSHAGATCTAQQCEDGSWCHSNGNSCENGSKASIIYH